MSDIMNPRIMGLLTAFAGAVFVGFLLSMLFSGGRADLNTYGEGWFEVAIAGICTLLGAWEIVRYKQEG